MKIKVKISPSGTVTTSSRPFILCVVIAGGKSSRMGGQDKFLLPFQGGILLDHIMGRLTPQVDEIVLNINQEYQSDLTVIKDIRSGSEGPLSGILTALNYAKNAGYDHVVTVACDTPFIPDDFISCIISEKSDITIAHSAGRDHPLMGNWHVSLIEELTQYLERGERRVMSFIQNHSYKTVEWSDEKYDPFFNINTPDDLKAVQNLNAVGLWTLKKYNPAFYGGGRYLKDEWTDISDIGKSFEGVILTREDYLKVENDHLSIFEYLMDQCKIEKLQVLRDSYDVQEMPDDQDYTFGLEDQEIVNYPDKSWLNRSEISIFLRLMMRGLSGYAVTNNKDFFIWGTGDYYHHIGLPNTAKIDQKIMRLHKLYFQRDCDYSSQNSDLEDYRDILRDAED